MPFQEAAKKQVSPELLLLRDEESRLRAESEETDKKRRRTGRQQSRVGSRAGRAKSDKSDGKVTLATVPSPEWPKLIYPAGRVGRVFSVLCRNIYIPDLYSIIHIIVSFRRLTAP